MDFSNHPINNPIAIETPIGIKALNPIVPIAIGELNDKKTVDILLKECDDIINPSYKPWFAKRFYGFEKYSVLKAASMARQDGKSAQKMFCSWVDRANS